jgi:hypothetical protein
VLSDGDGNPRQVIDGSGNVVIGATSAIGKFNVFGGLSFLDKSAAGTQEILKLNNSDTTVGTNAVKLTFSNSGVAKASITSAVYGNGYMAFATNDDTEKMRIDAGGNLLVGTTTATGVGGITITPKYELWNASDASLTMAYFQYSSTTVGSISRNTTSTTYSTSSDYRLKEDIAPMTGALATVAQLKPVTYNWISDKSKGQGFIAHELQAVVPDCVTGEKDAVDAEGKPVYQGIDTSFLVATLTAAIQELSAQITTLQAQVTALQGK